MISFMYTFITVQVQKSYKKTLCVKEKVRVIIDILLDSEYVVNV